MMTNSSTSIIVYAFIRASETTLFAARSDGLFRSDDEGANWRYAYETLDSAIPVGTTAVALNPHYDSQSEQHIFAGVPGGILRSINGGESWDFVVLAEPLPVVSAIVVSPAYDSDSTVLAATIEDGIYRSETQGKHWQSTNFGLLDFSVYALAASPDFAADEIVFAATESGIFRSMNGGRAWRETDFPMDAAPVLSLALSPDYERDGLVVAGTESSGLFTSYDRGATWSPVRSGNLDGAINQVVLSSQYPYRPHILALAGDTLLQTTDNGLSWRQIKHIEDTGIGRVCTPIHGQVLQVALRDSRTIELLI